MILDIQKQMLLDQVATLHSQVVSLRPCFCARSLPSFFQCGVGGVRSVGRWFLYGIEQGAGKSSRFRGP